MDPWGNPHPLLSAQLTPTPDRVVSVRNSLHSQGVSEQATDLIYASWRKSTEKAYNSAWRKWCSWCQGRDKDPFSAPVTEVIEFLTSEFGSGKQYSSINTYRTVISTTNEEVEGAPVGKHPMICRLMQGVYNSRPPMPKYAEIWDVSQVLNFLDKQGVNLDLKLLTCKTEMLLALAHADRASDLHLLDISHVKFESNGVKFVISALRLSKTRRSGPPREAFYAQFKDNTNICPVNTLKAYLEAIKPIRSPKERKVFISFKKPHLPVSIPPL